MQENTTTKGGEVQDRSKKALKP